MLSLRLNTTVSELINLKIDLGEACQNISKIREDLTEIFSDTDYCSYLQDEVETLTKTLNEAERVVNDIEAKVRVRILAAAEIKTEYEQEQEDIKDFDFDYEDVNALALDPECPETEGFSETLNDSEIGSNVSDNCESRPTTPSNITGESSKLQSSSSSTPEIRICLHRLSKKELNKYGKVIPEVISTDKLICEKCLLVFKNVSDLHGHLCPKTKIRTQRRQKPYSTIKSNQDTGDESDESASEPAYDDEDSDWIQDEEDPIDDEIDIDDKMFGSGDEDDDEPKKLTMKSSVPSKLIESENALPKTKRKLGKKRVRPPKPSKKPRCSKCNNSFNSCVFEGHMKICTGVEGPPFPCSLCKKTFKKRRNLFLHLKTHNKQRDYKCTICDYAACHVSNFRRHMQTHSDAEKKHKCTICDYSSHDKYSLEIHMLIHAGEKKFKCSACPTAFTNPRSLYQHKRNLHEDYRAKRRFSPIQCNICGIILKRKSFLRNHIAAVHENLRPYSCDTCQKLLKPRCIFGDI